MKEYVSEVLDNAVFDLEVDFKKGAIVSYKGGQPVRETKFFCPEYFVGKIEFTSLKVEVFSREHPPPHFRVKYQGSTANFRISDCECISGGGEVLKYHRNIKRWWKGNKDLLISAWNERRPDDCPVGDYREND